MMITAYLAARFGRQQEMVVMRERLKPLGIDVTSRWLDEKPGFLGDLANSEDFNTFWTARLSVASQDLEDIDKAEWFIHFTEEPDSVWPRGGRHVEHGYAMARGKRIIIVGPRENLFHYSQNQITLADKNALRSYILSVQWATIGVSGGIQDAEWD